MGYLLFSLAGGVATDYFLHRYLKQQIYPWTFLLSLLSCTALLWLFDNPIQIIKGYFFAQMLIAIGYCYAKTHEIPDTLLIPIILAGLIGIKAIPSAIGFFIISLPLLLFAKFTHCGIGGGDVKFMAASGFFLGYAGAVSGFFIGLIVSSIAYPFSKNRNCKATQWHPI